METTTVFELLTGNWYWAIIVVLAVLILSYTHPGSLGFIIVGLAVIIVLVCVLSYFSYTYDANQKWREWANDHCEVVEKKDGHTSIGVGVSTSGQAGAFLSPTPDQTAYKCDDGITYWKKS